MPMVPESRDSRVVLWRARISWLGKRTGSQDMNIVMSNKCTYYFRLTISQLAVSSTPYFEPPVCGELVPLDLYPCYIQHIFPVFNQNPQASYNWESPSYIITQLAWKIARIACFMAPGTRAFDSESLTGLQYRLDLSGLPTPLTNYEYRVPKKHQP